MSKMSVELTPIEDVTGVRATVAGKWDATIAEIEKLESRAAKFTVPYMEDDLAKFKRQFRSAANKIGRTALFGQDAQDGNGNTTVQVKLIDKQPGRPAGVGNAPKTETSAKGSAKK